MTNEHSTNLDLIAAVLQTIGGSPVDDNGHRARVTKRALSLAFSALDEIQQALGDCPSPLPTPESLCCTSCKGSGASAPDGTECSWCAGSGLREGVTIRDVEEAYAVRPSPAPTISVEEALTSAVRKADEAFERVGGSSRHWVRDCFLPALETEGLSAAYRSREKGEASQTEIDFLRDENRMLRERVSGLLNVKDLYFEQRNEARAEVEKWRGSAAQFCGAHVGVKQARCPACERDELLASRQPSVDRDAGLKAEIIADYFDGRDEVDKALFEHGYESMDFANVRHGWLFSTSRICERLKHDEDFQAADEAYQQRSHARLVEAEQKSVAPRAEAETTIGDTNAP